MLYERKKRSTRRRHIPNDGNVEKPDLDTDEHWLSWTMAKSDLLQRIKHDCQSAFEGELQEIAQRSLSELKVHEAILPFHSSLCTKYGPEMGLSAERVDHAMYSALKNQKRLHAKNLKRKEGKVQERRSQKTSLATSSPDTSPSPRTFSLSRRSLSQTPSHSLQQTPSQPRPSDNFMLSHPRPEISSTMNHLDGNPGPAMKSVKPHELVVHLQQSDNRQNQTVIVVTELRNKDAKDNANLESAISDMDFETLKQYAREDLQMTHYPDVDIFLRQGEDEMKILHQRSLRSQAIRMYVNGAKELPMIVVGIPKSSPVDDTQSAEYVQQTSVTGETSLSERHQRTSPAAEDHQETLSSPPACAQAFLSQQGHLTPSLEEDHPKTPSSTHTSSQIPAPVNPTAPIAQPMSTPVPNDGPTVAQWTSINSGNQEKPTGAENESSEDEIRVTGLQGRRKRERDKSSPSPKPRKRAALVSIGSSSENRGLELEELSKTFDDVPAGSDGGLNRESAPGSDGNDTEDVEMLDAKEIIEIPDDNAREAEQEQVTEEEKHRYKLPTAYRENTRDILYEFDDDIKLADRTDPTALMNEKQRMMAIQQLEGEEFSLGQKEQRYITSRSTWGLVLTSE